MHTDAPLPIFASTTLATACLAAKLRLDAHGWVAPHGNTVRYPAPVGPTAVTFSTADPIPSAGNPARGPTVNGVTLPAGRTPAPWDWPSTVEPSDRVSMSR